jgi:hypothetical protein
MRRIVSLVATAAMLVMMSVAPAVAQEDRDELFKDAEKQAERCNDLRAEVLGAKEREEAAKASEKYEEEGCPPIVDNPD